MRVLVVVARAASLTGRASRGIAKRLERHGASLVAPPESPFVGRDDHLAEGEAARAEVWGAAPAGSPDPGGAP